MWEPWRIVIKPKLISFNLWKVLPLDVVENMIVVTQSLVIIVLKLTDEGFVIFDLN